MAAKQSGQPGEQHLRQESAGWILPLVYTVFYLSAFSLWMAGGIQLTRWGLPGGIAWSLSGIGGAAFGVMMVASLLRLPRLDRLYEAAPVNGATGAPLTPPEVVIPFLQIALCLGLVVGGANRTRIQRHLPPLLPPGWVIYLPWMLAIPMAAARGYASLRRDPAEGSRRAEEEARRYEEALTLNEEARAALLQCAEDILACWERNPFGQPPALLLDQLEFEHLEAAVCRGIAVMLPEHQHLHAARCFISDLLHAAYQGQSRIIGDGERFKAPRELEWGEAIALLREVAEYLRSERPLENPRFWKFIGWKPQASTAE